MSIEDDVTTAEESPQESGSPEGPWVFAGRFEILALVGAGGMGSVYKAFDRELEEIVALKVIRRELMRLPGIVERFRREVKLARRITHKNVGRVFDMGESAGERYFSMEFIEGKSLETMLEQGALPVAVALRVARDLADGLSGAHQAGVIHRDLKPDNVLLAGDGRAVITDFGIARSLTQPSGPVTLEGGWIGTPVYMAPELVGGQAIADELCDIFSLGVMLYELVTGELPWSGPTEIAIAMDRLKRDAPNARVLRPRAPESFAAVIAKCLARERSDRYASAAEVGAALATVELGVPTSETSKPASRSERDTMLAWSINDTPAAFSESAPGAHKTVAVLPFREAGAGPDSYLASGLTEALIDALSLAPELRVRPRGMVLRFADAKIPPLDAGRALGVQVVVDGALAADGPKLALSVRVISVADKFPIWAGRFEREPSELLQFSDELATTIAGSLSAKRTHSTSLGTMDHRATELYFRARKAYHGFWHAEVAKSVLLFAEALALAPTDGVILAGHALACIRESNFTGEGIERARAAVDRAFAVGPDLPEVHLALASLHLQGGDPVHAVRELKKALARAPALGEANWLLGRILVEAGVVETGMKRLEWALAIEPELHLARRDLARANALLGRFDEVERIAANEPRGHEAGAWLDVARFSVWAEDAARAEKQLAMLAAVRPGLEAAADPMVAASYRSAFGLAHASLRLAARGESPLDNPIYTEFMSAAEATPRRAAFGAQLQAEVFARLGRTEDALEAIGRSVASGLTDLGWLERCPLFRSLHQHEAFEIARARVGATASRVREVAFDE